MIEVTVNIQTGEKRPLTIDEKTRILRVKKDYGNRDSLYVLSDDTFISLPMAGCDTRTYQSNDPKRVRTTWEDSQGNLYAAVRNPSIKERYPDEKIRFVKLIPD